MKFQPSALFRVLRDHRYRDACTERVRGSRSFSIFYIFFCTYIRDVRVKSFEKLSGEKFRINGGEKNVVVNVDGGFQYSGNYVVTGEGEKRVFRISAK